MRAIPFSLLLFLAACGSNIAGPGGDDTPKDTSVDTPAALSVDTTGVEFGEVPLDTLETASLVVTNTGDGDLTITSITVDAPFTVSPMSATVYAQSSTSLTLRVQLTDYDDHAATLTIASDDAENPSVTVPVHALAIADADGDGYDTTDAGGDDCDDGDADVHPGGEESWYDGIDSDCAGDSDFDQDGDGYDAETDNHHPGDGLVDCNDVNADYHPGAADTWYDNKDTNCDGADDYDQDGDGYHSDQYGAGTDCDDLDPTVYPDATEAWDGLDNDCNDKIDDNAEASGATWVYEADGSYDAVGTSLAIGDLDGDGLDDLVIGASGVGASSPADTGKGAVAVLRGGDLPASGSVLDAATCAAYVKDSAKERFGETVAIVGDWDGDGLDDVTVHAGAHDTNAGEIFVFGGQDLLDGAGTADALYTVTGSSGNQLGHGLSTRLDLDGDGLGDLAAWYGQSSKVGLTVTYGGATGAVALADTDATWIASVNDSTTWSNGAISGDLDGDGLDDLVVGAGGETVDSATRAGAVYALAGSSTRETAADATLESSFREILAGSAMSDGVGTMVAMGEDWDGDGDQELWVYDDTDAIYVIEGGAWMSAADPAEVAAVTWKWTGTTDPTTLRRAGDWDGDGVDDMMVYVDSGAGDNSLLGSAARSGSYSVTTDRMAEIKGSTTYGNSTVGSGTPAGAGDLDGDGLDDFALGDPGFDGNHGEVYVTKGH